MQLEPACRFDVLRAQRLALGIVEQHHARPVFLLVLRLLLAEEFNGSLWDVYVLHDHHGIALVPQLMELRDVIEHHHIAVHEYGPILVAGKIGREKAGEREIRALERMPLSRQYARQLRQPDLRDSDRLRGMPLYAVGQDVTRDLFPLVIAYENSDHDRICRATHDELVRFKLAAELERLIIQDQR